MDDVFHVTNAFYPHHSLTAPQPFLQKAAMPGPVVEEIEIEAQKKLQVFKFANKFYLHFLDFFLIISLSLSLDLG